MEGENKFYRVDSIGSDGVLFDAPKPVKSESDYLATKVFSDLNIDAAQLEIDQECATERSARKVWSLVLIEIARHLHNQYGRNGAKEILTSHGITK